MKKGFGKLSLVVAVVVVCVATLWHRGPAWVFGADAPAPIGLKGLHIDHATDDQPVSVTLELKDADVRAQTVNAVLKSPDGLDSVPISFARKKNLGQWAAQLRLPTPAEPGTWTIENLQVVDDTGATTNLPSQASLLVTAPAERVHLVRSVHVHPGPFRETQILPVTLTFTGEQPVQSVDVFLRGPDNQKVSQSMMLPGGTTGEVEVPVRLPKGFGAGTWHLQLLRVTAVDGTVQHLFAGQDFPGDLKVQKGRQDKQPPVIQSVQLSADTLAAGNTLTVRTTVTDDLSGVALVFARVLDERGHEQGDLALSPGDDGVYTGKIDVPAYASAGKWSVRVQAGDVAGNAAPEQTVPLAVTAAQTKVAPVGLRAVSLQALTASLLLRAETTGDVPVTQGLARLRGPGQSDPVYVSLSRQNDGVLQASLPLADQTPSGTWMLTQLELIDAAGQDHVYEVNDLPSASTTATVANAHADNNPPIFDRINSSSVINAGGRIHVALTAHDEESGVAVAYVTLQGPHDRVLSVPLQWNEDTQQWVGSAAATGSAGEWHVQAVDLKDAAGNVSHVRSGAGFEQAIQVRG